MSLQQLKELGDHIIKAAESSPLQSEIAAVSLESIHTLLVSTDQNTPNDDLRGLNPYQGHNVFEQGQIPYQHPMQPQMMQPQGNIPEYGIDEQMQTPQVFAPQINADIISQARNIPFLYHNNNDN